MCKRLVLGGRDRWVGSIFILKVKLGGCIYGSELIEYPPFSRHSTGSATFAATVDPGYEGGSDIA